VTTYSHINKPRVSQYGIDFILAVFSNVAELSLEVRVIFTDSGVDSSYYK